MLKEFGREKIEGRERDGILACKKDGSRSYSDRTRELKIRLALQV